MTDCNFVPTYLLSRVRLEDGQDTPMLDNNFYRQLVGSLIYLTHTQLDLSYAVGVVSKHMQELHELHWNISKHILIYVQGTISYGIHYVAGCKLDLIGFNDFDWADDGTDHNSTSRYTLSLGSWPICWSKKKYYVIDLSLPKAKYRGVVNITIHALWLQNFLTKLGI